MELPWKVMTFQPKPLDEMIESAKVVVDTNVLLAAYQWKDVTLAEITSALMNLAKEGRLFIPLHVVKEFTKNRPGRIAEMIQHIGILQSTKLIEKKLSEQVPALEASLRFKNLLEIEKEINEKIREYRKGLGELKKEAEELFEKDAVLDSYIQIFNLACYNLDGLKLEDELIKEAMGRFEKNIPPGFKDKGKKENNAGDYIIWANILALKDDVIFVSADTKSDWVISGPNDSVYSARRELIEEFFKETEGKSFRFLTPLDFFKRIIQDESSKVIEDLEQIDERKMEGSSMDFLNEFYSHSGVADYPLHPFKINYAKLFSNKERPDMLMVAMKKVVREFLLQKHPDYDDYIDGFLEDINYETIGSFKSADTVEYEFDRFMKNIFGGYD